MEWTFLGYHTHSAIAQLNTDVRILWRSSPWNCFEWGNLKMWQLMWCLLCYARLCLLKPYSSLSGAEYNSFFLEFSEWNTNDKIILSDESRLSSENDLSVVVTSHVVSVAVPGMWWPPPAATSGTFAPVEMKCLLVGYSPLWSLVITLASLTDRTPLPLTAGKVRVHEWTWRETDAWNSRCIIEFNTAITFYLTCYLH